MIYEIITDEKAMTITVGNVVYREPQLARIPEHWLRFKEEICGPLPAEVDPAGRYKWYASQLGTKFNRRFQAANYWLWVGNRFSEKTGQMLKHEGRHWRAYDPRLVVRANNAREHINQAERDGLYHIVPMIVACGASPHELRKRFGQGAWRRVAANSMTRNVRLMHAALRCGADDEEFVKLLDFPSGVLRGVYRVDEESIAAARITPRKTAVAFTQTRDLVIDTARMVVPMNYRWSLSRMKEEHSIATKALLVKRYSDKRFADDWTFSADGFTATLLTTQLDIAAEGSAQHHCVASYAREASRAVYAVFRIEGKERATAGYLINRGRLSLSQVYGAFNSAVSDECRDFAHQIEREFTRYERKAA